MARTQKKASKAPKEVKVNHSRIFNFSSMMNALTKVGVPITKAQKAKVIAEATRASTRARTQAKFYSPPVIVAKTKRTATKTKRAVSKSKRIVSKNANENVNMAVAAAPVSKAPRILRARQLHHIMKSYEGKPEKANTYAHFKRLHDLYESKKNVYGFTGETDIQDLIRTLKQQDELAQSEVDDLAALFGSTGL